MAGEGGQTITFFMNYTTYKNYHGHSSWTQFTDCYFIKKKFTDG
jgi:hypothetical protein